MKVLLLSGSRNPRGKTARAASALLRGAALKAATTEALFLPQMTIERCRQCEDNGWGICRSEGRCTIGDDFAPLVAKIREADAVVFATPVYFSDLSESLRAFLDRLRRISMHEDGRLGLTGKPAVGICVAGGGGGGAPNCCLRLETILRRCGFDLIDMVPVRRQNLEMKLGLLEETGKWLATSVEND